jgi:hypothetical protein
VPRYQNRLQIPALSYAVYAASQSLGELAFAALEYFSVLPDFEEPTLEAGGGLTYLATSKVMESTSMPTRRSLFALF